MKSSVIVFPGSNCDRDVAVALEKFQIKNQMVWHDESNLPKSDLVVLPGGFSYGDYLRTGCIASKSRIISEVIKHAKMFFEKKGIYPERYISFQPTAPLITSKSLTEAIVLHKKTRCDSVVSIAEVTQGHPYWTKHFDPETNKLLNFLDIDVYKYPQRQDLPKCYRPTGGFSIRKTKLLNESKRFYLGKDIRGYQLTSEESLDINTLEDMRYFEYLITKKS